ncbi:MBOAT-domain-containing protein [Violaceomyces palustris]|uniref:MBOAT-domain-containing protein n=1 Tax=Violaceomyces palustris TaxID=1673888 RepID=A0ACD0P7N0_9BASI|nr:MBOAT-domain-containing protein [Violaceomyces palustris]
MFDHHFQKIADQAGTPVDYLKLFVCLLISYPLASAFPLIRSPNLKHAYNLAVSTFFFLPILQLRWGYLQLLATSLATYYICLNRVGGRRMGWIVFGLQMGHLTCNHIYRQFGNIPLTTIEITSMQMVLCMNLTTFGWDCFDGQIRSQEECDEHQKKTRITQMPSLLEFLGYSFYFPGVMVGPSQRFSDYRAWTNGSLFASPKGKEKADSRSVYPSGRIRASLFELGVGLGFMTIYATVAGGYGYERLIGAQGGVQGWSLMRRIVYINVAGFMARTKYYGIWSLTNGACILSGLGYNGLDPLTGRTRWDRCRNIDIPKIEFANNWKELLDHWNMNTNVWLRNNVYKRVARPGKKPGFKSTMTTFLTSAFWHGLAPGYYLSFFLAGLMQSVARSLRRHVRPIFFKDPKKSNPSFGSLGSFSVSQLGYCLLSILTVQLTLNYAVAPFMLLDLGASLRGWRAVGFYGHLATVLALVAFKFGLGNVLDSISGRRSTRSKQVSSGAARQGQNATTGTESEGESLVRKREGENYRAGEERISSIAPEPIS